MENNNIANRSGKVWAGLIIAGIGSLLLLDNLGLDLPGWLWHWSNILILIGLLIGIKHNFRNSGWFIMVLIGSFFTFQEAFGDYIDFGKVIFPIMLMVFGLFVLVKPKNSWHGQSCGQRRRKFRGRRGFGATQDAEEPIVTPDEGNPINPNDYIDSVNVFGGSHQTIYSKNFKGGEIVAVFGGCDVNLTQADFEGHIILDVTAIFGGAKIIIPPGWQIKPEITSVFGGMDDKRVIQPVAEGDNKLLIIRGVALFGGVDIRNY